MKLNKTLALAGVLGMLVGWPALAQPTNNTATPRPYQPQNRPGWGRLDPQARHQALLKKYDANKDGKLDEKELAAIGKDVEDGKLVPGMLGGRRGGPGFARGRRGYGGPGFARGGRGYGGPGGPGFGRGPRGPRALGGPGFGPRHEAMLQKYDLNHDGRLDDSERAAIRKDIEDGKLQRPGFGRGPRGFGPPPGVNAPDAPPPAAQPPTDDTPQD